MRWKKVDMKVRGTLVKGDPSVPATHWWNILWLLFFGWRQVVILRANTQALYRVGFRDFRGKTMLCTRELTSKRFRAKIGREDCTFFAIDARGNEVVLEEVVRVPKNNVCYKHVPMI